MQIEIAFKVGDVAVDIKKFSEYKTGKLVPLENVSRKAHAFVPNPLPPQWSPGDRLWSMAADARGKIGELEGRWGASGIRDPQSNLSLVLRPLQKREAIRSSSLEGTHVTPEELLMFEKSGKEIDDKESDRNNQMREVLNCDGAMIAGQKLVEQGVAFDRRFYCELHRVLMNGVRGANKNPGQIRDRQVYIGRQFTPTPATELDACLSNLESYMASPGDTTILDDETSLVDEVMPGEEVDPLIRAFVMHYQFEAIHPFMDGNGRVGRLLLSLAICKWLELSHPWLYLSEFFENHRSDYFERLFRVSTHGEWSEWIELCLQGTIEQSDVLLRRCERLGSLVEEYKKKVGLSSPRMHSIIEMLVESPLIHIIDVQNKFEVSYPTARADIQKLVDAEILVHIPNHYPKMFSAREIFHVAYLD